MSINFPQLLSQFIGSGMVALILGCCGVSTAQALDTASPNWVVSNEKGGELMLEVRQLLLSKALDAVAGKIHVPIHYSALPEELVTATCKGNSLKQVLECLLDKKADLIFRYQTGSVNVDGERLVAEAWVLGPKANKAAANLESPTVADMTGKGSRAFPTNHKVRKALPDRTDELLAKAQSTISDERVEAIAALLTGGRKGDSDVKAQLEQALTDRDPNVRAQAISSLSHREGSDANGYIQQALLDSSEDVRIMAVEGIVDDVALLQQAASDSDESVRSLAQIKLELLTQNGNNNP